MRFLPVSPACRIVDVCKIIRLEKRPEHHQCGRGAKCVWAGWHAWCRQCVGDQRTSGPSGASWRTCWLTLRSAGSLLRLIPPLQRTFSGYEIHIQAQCPPTHQYTCGHTYFPCVSPRLCEAMPYHNSSHSVIQDSCCTLNFVLCHRSTSAG